MTNNYETLQSGAMTYIRPAKENPVEAIVAGLLTVVAIAVWGLLVSAL